MDLSLITKPARKLRHAFIDSRNDNLFLIKIKLFVKLVSVFQSCVDEFVKSRHSGENRSPDALQLLEKTGFRLSPE